MLVKPLLFYYHAQLFESHGGLMGEETFAEFSLAYLSRIASEVKQRLREQGVEPPPMTVFAKGAHYALEALAGTEYDIIGLDWTIDPVKARQIADKHGKALQGNLDPAALYGSVESIGQRAGKMVGKFGTRGYIANLGHGMHPDMDPEHLKAFVNAVHESSEALIRSPKCD